MSFWVQKLSEVKMNSAVASAMDNAAFFDNVTWLNQENWKNYFGKSLPNGVLVNGSLKLSENAYTLSGTMDVTTNASGIIIGAGAVMANGFYAENLQPVQIPHTTQSEGTKFICVQFDLESANANIVCKTNVVGSGDTIQGIIRALNVDESYLCERTPIIYEIPLAFEAYGGNVIDLRRLVYSPSGEKHYLDLTSGKSTNGAVTPGVLRGRSHAQVYGGTTYFITIDSNDVDNNFVLYPVFASSTEPIIVCITNNSGTSKNLTLSNSVNDFGLSYEWVDSWQSNAYGKYTDIVSGSSKILILFPIKITSSVATFGVLTKGSAEGGSVDPDSVYTKQEINNLLALKANSADMSSALAQKENISSLKALAYQDRVDYNSQLNNKPVLGNLADHDTVNYETEVTNKPTLGALADHDTIDYITEVTNKPDNIVNVTYYVSRTNGDDTNEGTQESPFRTIQKAIDSVGFNYIGTIIIASDTYKERLVIKGKHVILKQAELPEETIYSLFETQVIINPLDGTPWGEYYEDEDEIYSVTVIENGILEFYGNFSVVGNYFGVLVANDSHIFIDGYYNVEGLPIQYCALNVTTSVINSHRDNLAYVVRVTHGSSFITKMNKVIIDNISPEGWPTQSKYGFFIENSYCYVYNVRFNYVQNPVNCVGCNFIYHDANQSLSNVNGCIQSLDFKDMAYTNDVLSDNKLYGRKNKEWIEIIIPEIPNDDPNEFGTLAFKNTVDYETELTNKPTLGALADNDTVNYETEVTNKPTFGALAFCDSLDYSEISINSGYYSDTFYVNSSTGSDSNNGKTEQTAFKTIQHAIDSVGLAGGNINIILGGNEKLSIIGKKINFTITTSSTVTLTGTIPLTIIDSVVYIKEGGTWRVDSDSTATYGTVHITRSNVIIDANFYILDTESSNSALWVNQFSKVSVDRLTLSARYNHSYGHSGIRAERASFCHVGELTLSSGDSLGTGNYAIISNSSIVMYGALTNISGLKKSDGGLILTGSNN